MNFLTCLICSKFSSRNLFLLSDVFLNIHCNSYAFPNFIFFTLWWIYRCALFYLMYFQIIPLSLWCISRWVLCSGVFIELSWCISRYSFVPLIYFHMSFVFWGIFRTFLKYSWMFFLTYFQMSIVLWGISKIYPMYFRMSINISDVFP